jgi:hypothetical protein
MNKVLGLALIAAGIVAVIAGHNASQSFSSDVSRFFTGSATNKAMWLLVGGAAAIMAGAICLTRRDR